MRRRRVEVKIVVLDVLAVIALRPAQAKKAFFENRVLTVPEGQGKAQMLLIVREAEDAVVAPAVRAQARLIEREAVPGGAALAVVLTHRAPLAVAPVK